ncbi:MAG TPA: DUF5018 domain-containing protein [Cyclobacteriaceae bacterium]
MKTWKNSYYLLFILLTAFACGTKDDPAPVKSAAKVITSFKITNPEATGTITDSDKKISITVPNGTVVTSLIPAIEISEKATVAPASGVAQDFTNSVVYTVTAEDGTTQTYTVTVTVSTEVSFTLSKPLYTNLQQDGVVVIYGTNFGTVADTKIVLTNVSTSATTTLQANNVPDSKTILVKIPADQVLGSYKIRVFKALESKEMDETFTVEKHAPEINSLDKTTVVRGTNIVISGAYFQASGNIVHLSANSKVVVLDVVSESTTSIEVTVPESTDAGNYTLSVTSNDKESFYNDKQVTVQVPANTPVITSLDKTSYKLGETITITGTNLKKKGVATNIDFVPFTSGVTQVRSGIANADGTSVTYVLPSDFTTGTYTISVEVDGEFSEDYKEVIQITK